MGSSSKRKLRRRKGPIAKRKRTENSSVTHRTLNNNAPGIGPADYSGQPPTSDGCTILDLPDLALQLVFVLLGVERLRAAQGTLVYLEGSVFYTESHRGRSAEEPLRYWDQCAGNGHAWPIVLSLKSVWTRNLASSAL
jgi:hypothetical protein